MLRHNLLETNARMDGLTVRFNKPSEVPQGQKQNKEDHRSRSLPESIHHQHSRQNVPFGRILNTSEILGLTLLISSSMKVKFQ